MSKRRMVVAECRVDIRVLATINRYYHDERIIPSSKSELIRQSLTLLAESLFAQRKAPDWRTMTEEQAVAILADFDSLAAGSNPLQALAKSLEINSVSCAPMDLTQFDGLPLPEEDQIGAMRLVFELVRNRQLPTMDQWEGFPAEGRELLLKEGLHPKKGI